MRTQAVLAILLFAPLSGAGLAAPRAKGQEVRGKAAPSLPVRQPQCVRLPRPERPFAFQAGEELEFDLDALGAQAGKMTMRVLPKAEGLLPVEVRARTHPFFAKVRRVTGGGTSYLDPRTLIPRRYVEDSLENDVRRTADVRFTPKTRQVALDWTIDEARGRKRFTSGGDTLDVAGAIYLLRQLPLKEAQALCFEVYGIRRLWRVEGRVEGKEQVSLPLGEFEAWRIFGVATRVDAPRQKREIHVWISTDARRLPLVAIGVIDLGAVRATLTGYARPGEVRRTAEGKETLKW